MRTEMYTIFQGHFTRILWQPDQVQMYSVINE